MTWASEEGLPLLKEEVVEYFPLLFSGGGTVCKNRKAFCLRVFSVSK